MVWRRILLVGVALFIIWGLAICALAGSVYTNDSGLTARAFRIELSEPVKITSFGGAFTVQKAEGKASEFVFSGGEAKAWDSFWLSWKPPSASVVKTEWLAAVPMDVTVISHTRTEAFDVDLASDDGARIPCTITRIISQEQVPFVVQYHVTSDNTGLSFTWAREDTHEMQEGADALCPN